MCYHGCAPCGKPLYLHLWLFDSRLWQWDMPSTWSLFLTLLTRSFFSPSKQLGSYPLWLSSIVFNYLWCCRAHQFICLKMYQIVVLATLKVSVFCLLSGRLALGFFFRLMMASFICINTFLLMHSKSFHEQLTTAKATLEIYSRVFICLVCHDLMREQAKSGHETD